ncbi:hypothetical protein AVEN_233577-1 [Araneus ventricosus]|uniref:Uncharacterized protein n=1 Tax=Araneus ventricosus TaxID=182803 RepID=A0A4Y2HQ45_ARAVE|nr:hypothetical protein AVEN_233577-1 [Araneus ventricosus]
MCVRAWCLMNQSRVKRPSDSMARKFGDGVSYNSEYQGADSDSDKEAADMGCTHQQMKLLALHTSRKIVHNVAHSSTTTDEK